jgi:hypothetical protein
LGDQIKKNAMDVACSVCRGEERCLWGFCGGNLRERDNLDGLGIDGRIILKGIFKKVGWGMD